MRQPGAAETRLITSVKHNITVGGKKDSNPFTPTSENIQEGEKQFQNYCSGCHGPDGLRTGVLFAEKMSPPVPLLNSPEVQRYTDGQMKWILTHGVSPSGMPAWNGVLTDDEMWKIVLYLRHLS